MKNNPYVGPRPYERGDRHFYGRERESRDLLALMLAEPVVLLNAKIIFPYLFSKGTVCQPRHLPQPARARGVKRSRR